MNHRHRNGPSGSPYGFDARQREQDEQMKMLHVGAVIYFGVGAIENLIDLFSALQSGAGDSACQWKASIVKAVIMFIAYAIVAGYWMRRGGLY